MRYNNLIEMLLDKVSIEKGITFINSENNEEFMSYSNLYENSLKVLSYYRKNGINFDDKVIIYLNDNKSFLYSFWACILGGIIAVPITVGSNKIIKEKLKKVINTLDTTNIITNQSMEQDIRDIECLNPQSILVFEDLEFNIERGVSTDITQNNIAFIQFSSGSTADPKGVVLTHENLITNLNSICVGCEVKEHERTISWMPLTHDMGLIGFHLAPMYANIDQILMPPMLFIRNPILYLEKVQEHKVSILSSPNFGIKHILKYLSLKKEFQVDLSHVRLLFNGAEPISYELCVKFIETMKKYNLKENIMFPVYGMAEASLAITFPHHGSEIEVVRVDRKSIKSGEKVILVDEKHESFVDFVKVGKPVLDCEVLICDDEGIKQDENIIGNIRIRGKNVTRGYYNNDEVNKSIINKEGWLETGDLGFFNNGELVITGRKKDIIFINGQNFYPHDIESLIEDLNDAKIKNSAVCGIPNHEKEDEIVIFVATKYKPEDFRSVAEHINNHVSSKIGTEVKYIIPITNIPKTTSGKSQRYKLVENYCNGEYDKYIESLEMNQEVTLNESLNDIEYKIKTLFEEALEIDRMPTEKNFFEMGGNSLKATYLISRINYEFNKNIEFKDVFDNFTIHNLAKTVSTIGMTEMQQLECISESNYYSVLPSQKRLYILNTMKHSNVMFNIIKSFEFTGKLNVDKIKEVMKILIDRHEALRTNFVLVDGKVFQKINKNSIIDYQVCDIDHKDINEFIDAFNTPFNLEEDVLFKMAVLNSKEKSILVFCIHHIIVDGTSLGLLIKDFIDIYNEADLNKQNYALKEYSTWKNKFSDTEAFQAQKEYWLKKYSTEVQVLNLPYDYVRPKTLNYSGNSFKAYIDMELCEKVKKLASENHTTEYAVLFSAFNTIINRYSMQDDFVIGSPAAARGVKNAENIVGMLINTLPIRVKIDNSIKYIEYLTEFSKTIFNDLANQYYYNEELIEDLNVKPILNRNALFDVVFNMQNMKIPLIMLDDIELEEVEIQSTITKVDLTVNLSPNENGYELYVEYSTELFREESIRDFIKKYIKILNIFTTNPELVIKDAVLLDEKEENNLLYQLNDTELPIGTLNFKEAFEMQAKETPNNIAIRLGKKSLSYQELNERANWVAKYINESKQRDDEIIAILMNRSIERAIVLIGCLKSGCAYLPIDSNYPLERIHYMLNDSKANILITDNSTMYNTQFNGQVLSIDSIRLIEQVKENPCIEIKPDDAAYIIYTSGTTGNPKGVITKQHNLWGYINAFLYEFKLNERDVFLQQASYSFDAFIEEMYPILTVGGSISICKNEDIRDINVLAQKIINEKVTIISASPLLINELDKIDMRCDVHTFISGGDVLKWEYIENIIKRSNVYNTYGPTETTVCATYYKCQKDDKGKRIPIGKPILNYRVYVLDELLRLCSVGIPGELCIGGIGVSKGYLNKETITNDKFVLNPYIEGERIYKTGDLVRWMPDGNLEYLGRIDKQVNVRGYRIETEEIEAQLLKYDLIRDVVVTDRENEQGEKYLVAYIISDREIRVDQLKSHLLQYLPEYMIPSYFVQLESMPVTENGKLNKIALPIPQKNLLISAEYEKPRNDVEIKLVELWKDVLGVEEVGINHNFFELGGHSLNVTVMASKIHKELGIKLEIKDLFSLQTIKQISQAIANLKKTTFTAINRIEKQEWYEVSSAQKRMYMLQKFDLESTGYNISGAVSIEGDIDTKKVKETLNELIARHESLRTYFIEVDDNIVQKICDKVDFSIEYIKNININIHKVIDNFINAFDLSRAPLFRVAVIRQSESNHVLVFDMHHIISDGVSMGILIDEFTKIYTGKELNEIGIQYKDFACWQNKLLKSSMIKKQEKYWIDRLSDELPILNMPTDYMRPSIQSFEGKTIRQKIPKVLYQKLSDMAKETNSTVYMILLSTINVLLAKYSGQSDIIVGSPIAGRYNADVQNVVGMFVNTLVMRNYPDNDKSFNQFLTEVKSNSLEAYQNQDYQLEELIDKLNLHRDLSRNPLFDVMFAMQNMDNQQVNINDLIFERFNHEYNISKFDLTFTAEEIQGELLIELEYCTKLFKDESANTLIMHLINILYEVTDNAGIKISEIKMISPEERNYILGVLNNTQEKFDRNKTFQQLFEEQVLRTPGEHAVVFENEYLTYDELNSRSNCLARVLRSKGVNRNKVVGIMVERSVEMIVGVLAIIKAGGVYLPIDPSYPEDRIQYMLSNSEAQVLLTQGHLKNKIENNCYSIDINEPNHYNGDTSNIQNINSSSDLIYITYTSGTTGNPKGVMVEHRNLVNVAYSWVKHYKLNQFNARLLQMASMSFDVFSGDLCRSLLSGGTMYICPNEVKLEFKSLYTLISTNKINIFESTPSLIIAFMDYVYDNNLNIDSLALLILGSDTCPIDEFKKLVERYGHKMRILNSYGVTEATIDSSYYEMNLDNIPELINTPIGQPLHNTEFYIVNSSLNLQPVGVIGELYIGGYGIASGYLKNEKLTNEKFIDNPFRKEEKMYKTGDLARWLPDGNVEFLGRVDNQVKIRGYRIEIREIENQLLNNSKIKEAVVIDKKDHNGTLYLCAFIVADEEIDYVSIKKYLLKKLPEYMVPAHIKQLTEMPITPNGKIDRKKLIEYKVDFQNQDKFIAPSTNTERKLESIWKEILGIEKVGVNNNFFEIGGHSLKAITLASRIHKEFHVEMPLKEIFKAPTIKEISNYINYSAKNEYDFIERAIKKDWYETSSAQKRMYMLQQLDPNSTGYNMSAAILIHGSLNKERLEESLQELILRHEGLRTCFSIYEGTIVQKIHELVDFHLEYSEQTDVDIEEETRNFVRAFDLSEAPLMRVKLIKQQGSHILVFDIHHIISDGISIDILINDISRIYSLKPLEPLNVQYKDYAEWQNKIFKSNSIKLQEKYWEKVFSDELPVLNMPTDFVRPTIQSYEGESFDFVLDETLTNKINKLAIGHGTTTYTVLLSAINILLSKYSGQDDIIVGSITAGRNKLEIENTMGVFINTLALRNYIDPDAEYASFIKQVKDNSIAAFENQDYPFEELIDKLNLKRDQSRNPLFDVMFSMENDLDLKNITVEGIHFEPVVTNRKAVNFDLRFIASERKDKINIKIEYSTKLFTNDTIQRISIHLVNILEQIMQNSDVKISDISLVTKEEKDLILYKFNDTEADYPKDKTFIELFEEQVKRTPNNIATIFKDQCLSYSDLNKKVNRLARTLRSNGVTRNSVVAIMVERSNNMMVGILAIIKAGGAYLPIDPSYSENRLNFIIENSNATMVLTQKEFSSKVNFNRLKVCIDNEESYMESDENLDLINTPKDLIYVIYTSGSTGNPKGVMIEHGSLVNRINWMQKEYPLTQNDIILQKTTYTFDVSVWEILWWSIVGAKVCLLEHGQEKDISSIVNVISKNRVTTIHFVPSMLNIFLEFIKEYQINKELSSLKRVFASGEALQTKHVYEFKERIFDKFGTQLINLYGPTEATIDVSYFNCFEHKFKGTIPIGKPIDNTHLYIIDKNKKLLPIGIPGELCIAGDGVARGYLNNQKLTQEKFIDNPYVSGTKMYKTGDLARWLPDGNIEYLGRIDHQVKLRGFRIELGEIENNLIKYPEIKETVVVVKKDSSGYEYLCAYFVSDIKLTAKELRSYLMQILPEYMIPTYFEQLPHMPLTSNGKLDRKALPEPTTGIVLSSIYEEPSNMVEQKLVEIWKELLNVDKVGVNENFFEIGGYSLKATLLISQISKTFNVDVPFREVFNSPTIKSLRKYISQRATRSYNEIKVVENQKYYHVSSAQKRMYLLQQFDPNGIVYNMPEVILIEGAIKRDRIQWIFDTLCNRHESLRTYFEIIDEEIVQFIDTTKSISIDYEEINGMKLEQLIESFVQPFNLNKSPLFRIKVVKLQVDKYAMIFDMHHIISDGVSKTILVEEFIKLYHEQQLPPLRIQYKDYAVWKNELLQQENILTQKHYWLNKLSGEIPILNLKSDYIRPSVQSFEGNTVSFKLSYTEVDGLINLAKENESTIYMVFLSLINILLSKYSNQEDILIGTPVTGRTHPDLQNLIGMFVNTLVIRNYPQKNKQYLDFLKEVKECVLAAYENQDYQFEDLVDELNIRRDVSRNPLFDVMFTMLNEEKEEMNFSELTFRRYKETDKTCKFDLNFSVIELEKDILVNIQYCTKLFKEQTIVQMGNHLKNLIAAVVKDNTIELGKLSVLSNEERNRIVYDFNSTEIEFTNNLRVQELFEKQVKENPNNFAVVFEDQAITYKELNNRANSVAWSLREQGVRPNTVVAIMMEKSIELIIGILGVIKSGGAYLPLDINYPAERIEYQLQDSEAQIVITDKDAMNFEGHGVKIVTIQELSWKGDTQDIDIINSPEDLVYVIYTSGSTGRPKGVMIEHRNLISLNDSLTELIYNNYKTPINIALLAPYIFDASVKQIFASLLNGNCLHLLRDEYRTNGEQLLHFYNKNNIIVSDGTPIILNILCDTYTTNKSKIGVEFFIIGGDVLSLKTVKEFRDAFGNQINIINIYGPTECCVDSTAFKITTEQENISNNVLIGKPLDNTKIYILNQNMLPVPIGVEGEIYISGLGVGRGYINNETLTKEKFINNPFADHERMYRTGDLAKWLPDGNIEFLGRIDNQVKIRGYRIELSEIENVLLKHKNIKEAIVIDKPGEDSVKYLCAYFVSTEQETAQGLRKYLFEILPDYMIPSHFFRLDKLPLTINGKIDRKKLLEITIGNISRDNYEGPKNQVEEYLQEIWSEVLMSENIGINDNFFELGGNSLSALKLVAKLRGNYKIDIGDIFKAQTIKELACTTSFRTVKKNVIDTKDEAVQILLEQFSINSKYIEFFDNDVKLTILFVDKINDEVRDFIKNNFGFIIFPNYIKVLENMDIIGGGIDNRITYEDIFLLLNLVNIDNKDLEELGIWNYPEATFKAFENNLFKQPVIKKYPILPIQQYTLEYDSRIFVEVILDEIVDDQILIKVMNDIIRTFGLFRSKIKADGGSLYWQEYEYLDHIQNVFEMPIIDISEYNWQSQKRLITYIRSKLSTTSFDDLLYRTVVLKRDSKRTTVMWSIHHSIFDGESSRILQNTFMKYYNHYKHEGVNTLLEIKDYDVFTNNIIDNTVAISEKELVRLLELEKYKLFHENASRLIARKVQNNSSNLFNLQLEISENNKSYFNRNIWEISFELFCAFCSEYLNMNNVPVLIYSNGRKHQDIYYDSIGEYIDLVPIVLDVNSNIPKWTTVKDKIDTLSKNKINFSNLVLGNYSGLVRDHILPSDSRGLNVQLMFNFVGYKSKEEQNMLKIGFKEYLSNVSPQNKGSQNVMSDGITFQVMYSENNINIMINGLNMNAEEQIKDILSRKLLGILEY